MIDSSQPVGLSENGVYPFAGNHPSPTARIEMSTSPSQNAGTASPTSDSTSVNLPRPCERSAVITPSDTPTRADRVSEDDDDVQRDAQARVQRLGHRLARDHAVPEIAVERVVEPVGVAIDERLVQPKILTEPLDVLGKAC